MSPNKENPSIRQFIMVGRRQRGADNVSPAEVDNYFKDAHKKEQTLKEEMIALSYRWVCFFVRFQR